MRHAFVCATVVVVTAAQLEGQNNPSRTSKCASYYQSHQRVVLFNFILSKNMLWKENRCLIQGIAFIMAWTSNKKGWTVLT
jgi:hypothetical protein